MQIEEAFNDSNSLFSASIIAPLMKRQTTNKKASKTNLTPQEKIQQIGYQIVQQLSIITPLEVNPKFLCQAIQTYKYQRKSPSLMEADFYKKQLKDKSDFIMAITSLFNIALTSQHHKFSILLPFGGLIYFLYEQTLDSPKILVSLNSKQFIDQLTRQQIKFRQLPRQQFEKQRLIIENNYIKLFFGFFLNWIIHKKLNIDIYSNYHFQLSLRDTPIILKTPQKRPAYEHLSIKDESCLGEKINRLYLIRYDGLWFKTDLKKIEEKLNTLEGQHNKGKRNNKIDHDYQFKIVKYSVDLSQFHLESNAIQ